MLLLVLLLVLTHAFTSSQATIAAASSWSCPVTNALPAKFFGSFNGQPISDAMSASTSMIESSTSSYLITSSAIYVTSSFDTITNVLCVIRGFVNPNDPSEIFITFGNNGNDSNDTDTGCALFFLPNGSSQQARWAASFNASLCPLYPAAVKPVTEWNAGNSKPTPICPSSSKAVIPDTLWGYGELTDIDGTVDSKLYISSGMWTNVTAGAFGTVNCIVAATDAGPGITALSFSARLDGAIESCVWVQRGQDSKSIKVKTTPTTSSSPACPTDFTNPITIPFTFESLPMPGQAPFDAALYLHTDATATKYNAYCLDGSKAGFYYRKASSDAAKNKWKLHFMGGGWATNADDLLTRSQGFTGSSNLWTPWLSQCLPPVLAGFYGLMSYNETSVSIVGDWNFVWFAYCDGSSQTSDLTEPLIVNGTSLHLRGRAILDAHLSELDSLFQFSSTATEVIVSGTSAGGLSTHLHAPLFAARLSSARVVAVPDAAFWWDTLAYNSTTVHPWLDALTPALPLWNASFNPANPAAAACLAVYTNDPVKCFTQPYQSAYSNVPTFHAQSLYDVSNLRMCFQAPCQFTGNTPGTCTPVQVTAIQQFARDLGESIKSTVKDTDGYFFQSCSQHETTCRYPDWFSVTTPTGATMNTTFTEWYTGTGAGREQDIGWPNDNSCVSIAHGFC